MKNAGAQAGIWLIHLLALLPLPIAHALGGLLGRILWWTGSESARIARINLRICFPEFTPEQVDQMARDCLVAYGRTCTEMGMSWCWPIPKVQELITHVEGLEYLQQGLDQKNGIILIAPHLGNWEILNHFFRQYLYMTVMYRPVKVPAVDNFIFETRKRVGVGLVPASREGVMALFEILENNGVVAVLPDQKPRPKSGVIAPFFGYPALTGKLIGELAAETDAYLLCCYAKRLENGGYGVVLTPGDPEIRNREPVASATALNKSIEECIRDCPEQYQWGYKRFGRQPVPENDPYRKAVIP
ncbi:KDO2-lipid IV(A) lauroyltransferase [Halospina denitrificans]|uniref:KDO2-lipid IV(A) lauroyltransferase n=1 Tax=Halospina denitrificans TaxID=332522 RepID=A0A4R7K0T4_9GAMM|nr:KDO2-lipid IV(A) lauroyltransferase [Halospina denitrificans]